MNLLACKKIIVYFILLNMFFVNAEPSVSTEKFRVGFQVFSTPTSDNHLEHLARSIPLMLYKKVSVIQKTRITETEYRTYLSKNRIISDVSLAQNLAKERKNKDESRIFLSKLQKNEIISPVVVPIQPDTINNPNDSEERIHETTLEFWLDHQKGFLISEQFVAPKLIAQKYNLDLLIYGELSDYHGILLLKISAYNSRSDSIVFYSEMFFSQTDTDFLILDLTRPLGELISGIKYAEIQIKTNSVNSRIEIDDLISNSGNKFQFLQPGTHSLKIFKHGYEPFFSAISLEPGELKEVEVELKPAISRSITIKTEPEPAKIYIGSEYSALTPCTIDFFKDKINCSAVFQDGTISYFSILPETSSEITISKATQEKLPFRIAKDNFYDSLGFFLVSATMSSICFGISEQYNNNILRVNQSFAANLITLDDYQKAVGQFQNARTFWEVFSWSSAAVSGSTFILAAFRFSEYLNSAGR